MRLAADDIDFQLLEIGEDGDRHAFVPGVAFGLEGVAGLKILGGFLGLTDKAIAFVGAEQVVGALASAANLGGALNFHFALALDETGAVLHVPAERAEEGIEKIVAQLGLGVAGFLEFGEALAERSDEAVEFLFKGFKGGGARHGAKFAPSQILRQARESSRLRPEAGSAVGPEAV